VVGGAPRTPSLPTDSGDQKELEPSAFPAAGRAAIRLARRHGVEPLDGARRRVNGLLAAACHRCSTMDKDAPTAAVAQAAPTHLVINVSAFLEACETEGCDPRSALKAAAGGRLRGPKARVRAGRVLAVSTRPALPGLAVDLSQVSAPADPPAAIDTTAG
jgi:hypothetical protein